MFWKVSLKCLTEIAGASVSQYEEQHVTLFTLTMMQLKQVLPLNTNIRLSCSDGKDDEQNFTPNLSFFLCMFLREHGQPVEKRFNLREAFMEVHPFCGAVAYVVGAQTDRTVQEHLIEKHMLLPNRGWDCRIQQATKEQLLEHKGGDGRDQLLDVIETELRARPDDTNLNIRLVALCCSSNKLRDAVLHCQEAEKTRAVGPSLEWCSCVIQTLEVFSSILIL
ncbi:hypothetical protein ASZ78_012302 [Callipepla squamata]|uniref:Uncharacterized protein n=1 Tax=Callipepla squamata TaxID=9009 RepID=A0A226MBC7_CALSU|nr:hypothetical protein ASZ78_012302 [Callipepla squamata]